MFTQKKFLLHGALFLSLFFPSSTAVGDGKKEDPKKDPPKEETGYFYIYKTFDGKDSKRVSADDGGEIIFRVNDSKEKEVKTKFADQESQNFFYEALKNADIKELEKKYGEPEKPKGDDKPKDKEKDKEKDKPKDPPKEKEFPFYFYYRIHSDKYRVNLDKIPEDEAALKKLVELSQFMMDNIKADKPMDLISFRTKDFKPKDWVKLLDNADKANDALGKLLVTGSSETQAVRDILMSAKKPESKAACAILLGEWRDGECVKKLIDLMDAKEKVKLTLDGKTRDWEVREAARHALQRITGRFDILTGVKWEAWWKDNKGKNRRDWLIDSSKEKDNETKAWACYLRAELGTEGEYWLLDRLGEVMESGNNKDAALASDFIAKLTANEKWKISERDADNQNKLKKHVKDFKAWYEKHRKQLKWNSEKKIFEVEK